MLNNEPPAESFSNDPTLVDELVSRMNDLEQKFKGQFNQLPMQQTLYEIISSMTNDETTTIEPLKLCAIFSDFAESFLDRSIDSDKLLGQNSKLNNELHKANDLIRRLTNENEYHLSKLKYLAKQLQIYKDSWKGKLTEKAVEHQISALISERDKEVDELRNKLADTEKEFVRFKFENRNSGINQSHQNFNEDSHNFSDLKGQNVSKSMIPKTMNMDKLYDELISMDKHQLIEY
jgi:hypothetical protein